MNNFTLILLLSSFIGISWATPPKSERDPTDVGLTTTEMIEKQGYPSETHFVTTEDGYIIQVHRIPQGLNVVDRTVNKGPILLMHGLPCSSADYVNMGPDRSLGYLLADLGYDVWIGNARGNIYSRNHTTLDPDNDTMQFWDFSWHEIGYYDLPAVIDFILENTGEQSLYYVGHSQGTTVFFVLTTTRPEYNNKIKLASLLAAAALLEHHDGIVGIVLGFLSSLGDTLQEVLNFLQVYEVPFLATMREWGQANCEDPSSQYICTAFLNLISGGADDEQMDTEMLSVISSNAPTAGSMKQAYHFLQQIQNGGFHQYDYGAEENLDKYGQETPPAYDLSLVTAPVAFYYGANDGLIAQQDIQNVISQIPNVAENYLVPFELFNHYDFLYAKDVVNLLYNRLIEVLQKY